MYEFGDTSSVNDNLMIGFSRYVMDTVMYVRFLCVVHREITWFAHDLSNNISFWYYKQRLYLYFNADAYCSYNRFPIIQYLKKKIDKTIKLDVQSSR